MDAKELMEIISLGETSQVQFKRMLDHQDKIAAEMIAMSNGKGGTIIFGVDDKTGDVIGLEYSDLQFIGNKLPTIASDLIKPQANFLTEVVTIGTKKLLLTHVEEGVAKPYKDNNGAIWVKKGADKRRLTDNNEQMRLFQHSGLLHMDEMIVPDTGTEDIDQAKVSHYLKQMLQKTEDEEIALNEVLYQNLGIVKKGNMTLGGLLFFSKHPQKYRPIFCAKAVAFYGNSIGGLHYRDSRDIIGTIPEMFKEGMLFFKQNLKHAQKGQNFNSVGILEISEIALEELLQNALIHRDFTMSAPVRLLIFDDRLEISSPGCLPNSLTVEKIKLGMAVARNSLLASYASKLLKYRGLGSGIVRAIKEQPNIEFINDESGNQFIVKIPREEPMP
ncbi:MAG: putative DNA binding domain-containing protein [Kiritimatiellaeota bacterium]|nr:putative DNA binding domain-containing protein [Kiritimatiellota bacterium]